MVIKNLIKEFIVLRFNVSCLLEWLKRNERKGERRA